MIESFHRLNKRDTHSSGRDSILEFVRSACGETVNDSRMKDVLSTILNNCLSRKRGNSEKDDLFEFIASLIDEYNKECPDEQIIALRKADYEQLQCKAVEDPLTGLYNRRFLDIVLGSEIDKAQRNDNQFSILLADVDNFKNYNDRYGHVAGDEALKRIAAALLRGCRKVDQVARYGGEEFLVLMPNTRVREAVIVAERIRREVEVSRFDHESMTISVGVASHKRGMTVNNLVQGCDNALYRAKRIGKNTVCSAYDDKRYSPRLPLRLSVNLRQRSSRTPLQAVMLDISQTGALILTERPLSSRSRVYVELAGNGASSSRPLAAHARVVRSQNQNPEEGYFHGLCFEQTKEAKFFANDLIESLVYGRNNVSQHLHWSE